MGRGGTCSRRSTVFSSVHSSRVATRGPEQHAWPLSISVFAVRQCVCHLEYALADAAAACNSGGPGGVQATCRRTAERHIAPSRRCTTPRHRACADESARQGECFGRRAMCATRCQGLGTTVCFPVRGGDVCRRALVLPTAARLLASPSRRRRLRGPEAWSACFQAATRARCLHLALRGHPRSLRQAKKSGLLAVRR